ncbi:hypothetical protein [Chryseobacterium taihuense]|uniref:Tox-MPTase4 domain-containing protein n=1 Tax=Chryseobacterium taihuense TaxID=1141221 RepID=A0ABY0QZD1_9FLAO|nr:hypothetical protein [Chryseobacterium taihuense]SDM14541.1 hypothetical protein SAMN05216273_11488 [Chryseobacterium taihuense]
MDFLISKNHNYNITLTKGVFTGQHGTIFWGKDKSSLVLRHNGNITTIIHESIHLYQIIKKQFYYKPFTADSQLQISINAEVAAFRVTHSLIGISGIFKLSNITPAYIKNNYTY